jgi:hypothetical protein
MKVDMTRPSPLSPAAIRSQFGKKTSDEIRALIDERFDFNREHLAWLSALAARLDALGAATVNDLPDDEFARVTAE